MAGTTLVLGFACAMACDDTVPPPPFAGVPDVRIARDATGADAADARDVGDSAAEPDAVLCREQPGDLTVRSKADLAQLDYVRVLDGNLLFMPKEGLWNQSVREVRGDVRLVGTPAAPVGAHVALAALSVIGGDLDAEHTVKGLVDIYRLTSIGGSLVAHDGAWGFWTPALSSIGGKIDIHDASYLALTLDALESLGGPVRIERAAGLTRFGLGQVAELGAAAEVLVLVDNPDLATLALGHLTAIHGSVRITGNPKLPRSVIDAVLTGITVSGTTTVCGNRDDEACP